MRRRDDASFLDLLSTVTDTRDERAQAKEDVAIYDEVDEGDYRSIVKGRLAEDDFIEEDNGVSGYADNGEDHWDRSGGSEDEEERGELASRQLSPGQAGPAFSSVPQS